MKLAPLLMPAYSCQPSKPESSLHVELSAVASVSLIWPTILNEWINALTYILVVVKVKFLLLGSYGYCNVAFVPK